MKYTVKYYCPKHKNELLYIEYVDDSIVKFFVPEPPKECPKCGKSYYKTECIAKRVL